MPDYGMGRVPSPRDDRDQLYPMSGMLRPQSYSYPVSKFWVPGPVLEQGSTPHCVGFAWAQWRQASPVRSIPKPAKAPFDYPGNNYGHLLYHQCKKRDGYEGDGTFVRMAAEVLKDDAHLQTYVWAETLADIIAWLGTKGPVVVGTNWHESMFDPPKSGFLEPRGPVAGGHAYTLIGYSLPRRAFRMVNSWGPHWGQNGRAWFKEGDFWNLLKEGGEAVAALEVAK